MYGWMVVFVDFTHPRFQNDLMLYFGLFCLKWFLNLSKIMLHILYVCMYDVKIAINIWHDFYIIQSLKYVSYLFFRASRNERVKDAGQRSYREWGKRPSSQWACREWVQPLFRVHVDGERGGIQSAGLYTHQSHLQPFQAHTIKTQTQPEV